MNDLFDPPSDDELEDDLFAPPSEDEVGEGTSKIGSAIRQFVQGGSFGFSDEVAGGTEAVGKAMGLQGLGGPLTDISLSEDGPTLDWDKITDSYRTGRDRERDALAIDERDNPGISTAANIAGAVVSPINKVMRGASLAKQGAALGGIAGLGTSEQDLTTGDAGNFGGAAVDVGTGALVGGSLGKIADIGGQQLKTVGSKAMSKLSDFADYVQPPRQKANTAEILAAAEKLGIKVTPGMLDDTGFIERLESSLAKSPSLFGQHVKRNQDKVFQGLNTAAEGLTEGASPLSPYQLGEKFKGGIESKVAERLDPLKTVFDEVAESTKNIPIGDRSKAAIQRNIENLDVYQLTGGAGKAKQYAEMIPKLQNANQVKTAMTLLRNDISSAQGAEKQVLIAIKEKLETLERNSIMRGAIASARKGEGEEIGRNIIGDLKDARSGYRTLNQDLQGVAESARLKTQNGPSAFLDSLESIPSEKVPDKFFNLDNNRQIMSLQKNFPEELELLKQGRLKDILDASIDNSMNGQGKFNAVKFLKEVEKLNPEAQKVLFKDNTAVIENLKTVKNSLPRNFNPSGTASEQSWQSALYSNVKDVPNYALYRAASSNLGKAVTLDISNMLKINPQKFGKFAGVLQQAEQRGPQGVAATHFILQQTNPEYRQVIKEVADNPDHNREPGSDN